MGKVRLKVLHRETDPHTDSIRSFLLVNYTFRARVFSRGHRFESYRFCQRNVAQLVRASIAQKSLRSHHLQIRYHYYPTAVAITIAITITEVPYEGCGSPRFFYTL